MLPTEMTPSTPLALAAAIAEWFPDLEGRAVAVADATVNHENDPIMPLCMVVFAGEVTKPMLHSTRSPQITEKIVVEFWRKSERYKLSDGSESPFYAYVDYRRDRDRLLHYLASWQTPDGSILAYQKASVVSDEHAYTVEFHFLSEYEWQDNLDEDAVTLDGVMTCFRAADPFHP